MKTFFEKWWPVLVALPRAIWLFFPVVLCILLTYVALVKLTAGQDVVIQAVESGGSAGWTIVCLILWTVFAWFSSRLVANAKTGAGSQLPPPLLTHFPRLLGYNVPVSLQLATLSLPTFLALGTDGVILIFIFHNAYYVLLQLAFSGKRLALKYITLGAGIAYLGFVITKGYLAYQSSGALIHVLRLSVLASLFFALQVGYCWLIYKRRVTILEKIDDPTKEKWWYGFNLLAAAGAVLYLVVIFTPSLAGHFGPLAFVLLAFGVLTGLFNLISYFSIKAHFNFFFLLFALALAMGSVSDPYQVRLRYAPEAGVYAQRPELGEYVKRWLDHPSRKRLVQQADSIYPFMVYLVLADGGASRSGFWVASVLSKLEDETRKNLNGDYFSNHILSLSSASGGSVGNATFYALLKEKETNDSITFSYQFNQFLQADFLTFTLGRYLGPDFIRHIFPLNSIMDRAGALEVALEQISGNDMLNRRFAMPLDSTLDYSGKLPILFINTTKLETGTPGLVSSVRFSGISERVDVLSLIDQGGQKDLCRANLNLSTATILSARFPYVSPAGQINGDYFVDGGYFDNSGAGITLELLHYLVKGLNDPSDTLLYQLRSKLRFSVIHISNNSISCRETESIHPFVNDLATPILTVANTFGAQTDYSNSRLQDYIRSTAFTDSTNYYRSFNLPVKRTDTTPYPMNWVISEYSRGRMKKNLDEDQVKKELDLIRKETSRTRLNAQTTNPGPNKN